MGVKRYVVSLDWVNESIVHYHQSLPLHLPHPLPVCLSALAEVVALSAKGPLVDLAVRCAAEGHTWGAEDRCKVR